MSVGKSVLDKERQRETWGERWERQRERENREGERSDGGGGEGARDRSNKNPDKNTLGLTSYQLCVAAVCVSYVMCVSYIKAHRAPGV